MSSATRIASTVKSLLKEAAYLSQQVYNIRPTTMIETRQLLQKSAQAHAQTSPSLAVSLLKLDKEIVYMRYEGVGNYIGNKIRSNTRINFSSFIPSFLGNKIEDEDTTNEGVDAKSQSRETKKKVARVAFMITKKQKQQLYELNYTDADVKTLTPIEALLIIEHNLEVCAGAGWKDQLSKLVKENDELQKEENERQKSNADQVVGNGSSVEMRKEESHVGVSSIEESVLTSSLQTIETDKNTMASNESASSKLPQVIIDKTNELKDDSMKSDQDLSTSSSAKESGTQQHVEEVAGWYEVIETMQIDNSESKNIIAVYKTHKEALECLEIKQELMNKRQLEQKKSFGTGESGNARTEAVKYFVKKRDRE